MAKNSQLWTSDSNLLLDGPGTRREELEAAARVVTRGGTFRYRFQFPAMRVGLYEVYWQRPLVAYWNIAKGQVDMLTNAILGYFTAYLSDKLDLARPIELWPRLQRREPYLYALHNFDHLEEHYVHQTALNILRFLDSRLLLGKPVPRSFVRRILLLPEHETLESWLAAIPTRANNLKEGQKLQKKLERCLKPATQPETHSSLPGATSSIEKLNAITYGQTATRTFEEAW